MKFKRIFLIILDSLGIGATKDSDKYGDGLANSLGHIVETAHVNLPNLKSLGLFELDDETDDKKYGYYTKAIPSMKVKSSLVSHFEMMGVFLDKEYKRLNLNKLNKDFLNLVHTEIDRKFIISDLTDDSAIVNKYGVEQIKTGNIIISKDYYGIKLFAHESSIPIKELVKIAETILNLFLDNNILVNKATCINFTGKTDEFIIKKEQLSIPFPKDDETVLEKLKKKGFKIITIGKSTELFNKCDMTNICKTNNDIDTIKKLIKAMSFSFTGICVANLSDLNYHGHRRDPKSYAQTLKGFDNSISLIVERLYPDDLLIITSDQGNDPTYTGNDHTREKVPVLVFNTKFKENEELPCLHTLADIGATIADNFNIEKYNGKSFLEKLK